MKEILDTEQYIDAGASVTVYQEIMLWKEACEGKWTLINVESVIFANLFSILSKNSFPGSDLQSHNSPLIVDVGPIYLYLQMLQIFCQQVYKYYVIDIHSSLLGNYYMKPFDCANYL